MDSMPPPPPPLPLPISPPTDRSHAHHPGFTHARQLHARREREQSNRDNVGEVCFVQSPTPDLVVRLAGQPITTSDSRPSRRQPITTPGFSSRLAAANHDAGFVPARSSQSHNGALHPSPSSSLTPLTFLAVLPIIHPSPSLLPSPYLICANLEPVPSPSFPPYPSYLPSLSSFHPYPPSPPLPHPSLSLHPPYPPPPHPLPILHPLLSLHPLPILPSLPTSIPPILHPLPSSIPPHLSSILHYLHPSLCSILPYPQSSLSSFLPPYPPPPSPPSLSSIPPYPPPTPLQTTSLRFSYAVLSLCRFSPCAGSPTVAGLSLCPVLPLCVARFSPCAGSLPVPVLSCARFPPYAGSLLVPFSLCGSPYAAGLCRFSLCRFSIR
ncbi:hypothetical protein C7M84_020003 [Penaeus vannamei]|uniref:Uncharacterized protein n=1 Tax=Penaeus vannamei TaxID=6689 RepID=A0A423SDA7_PENVA|nr:hypothetical protein C7M84_020003 [Penaeus vannamei]